MPRTGAFAKGMQPVPLSPVAPWGQSGRTDTPISLSFLVSCGCLPVSRSNQSHRENRPLAESRQRRRQDGRMEDRCHADCTLRDPHGRQALTYVCTGCVCGAA